VFVDSTKLEPSINILIWVVCIFNHFVLTFLKFIQDWLWMCSERESEMFTYFAITYAADTFRKKRSHCHRPNVTHAAIFVPFYRLGVQRLLHMAQESQGTVWRKLIK
jgi:cell division protein FtsW (lipid II flippase)